jgi:hypothetical protein
MAKQNIQNGRPSFQHMAAQQYHGASLSLKLTTKFKMAGYRHEQTVLLLSDYKFKGLSGNHHMV